MKKIHLFIISFCIANTLSAQHQPVDISFGSLPPFLKWYQNSFGVSPIALHTGNRLINSIWNINAGLWHTVSITYNQN